MSCKKNITRGCCFRSNPQTNTPEVSAIEGSQKLEVHDWIANIPNPIRNNNLLEVQFKNTRKGFYQNNTALKLKKGDVVVVESQIGYDIGVVTMTSELVYRQMRRIHFKLKESEYRSVLRLPTASDIHKWQDAISQEHTTMIRSRQISASMGLDMKIGDVEYQADKAKAIFYYIADGRVDFRELIKVFAEQFRVRIEMKQIGARQEAGRIGGLGACGRELCCATWQNNFSSVSINTARVQDITPNPQKLAGQCGKLKCCLNFEMDTYIDARNSMPRVNQPLETLDATYYLVKSDPLKGLMYFSSEPRNPSLLIPLTADKVRIIMSINRKGEKVANLDKYSAIQEPTVVAEPSIEDVVGQDSLTRFDKQKRSGNRRRNNNNNNNGNRTKGGQGNNTSVAASSEQPSGEAAQQGGAQEGRQRANNRNRKRRADRPQSNGEGSQNSGGQNSAGQNSGGQNNKAQVNKPEQGQQNTKAKQKPQKPKSPQGNNPQGNNPQEGAKKEGARNNNESTGENRPPRPPRPARRQREKKEQTPKNE
ncbi:MAG: regulatory iron-sulfur-containing complex subunit RicT [Rikenellaceae bacterium]